MTNGMIKLALGTLALAAAPALAQHGGGGGGGGMGNAGGMGGSAGSIGGLGVGGMGPGSLDRPSVDTGVSTRDSARIDSRGPDNASPTAIDRANANSVLSGTTSSTTTARLHGTTRTMPSVTLPASATNRRVNSQGAAHASVNGLAHANSRSALGGAGSTALLGVAKGTTVTGTGGTSVGTVSSLVTNRAGAVVGVKVALAGGGTAIIPASRLSLSGSTLTTTWVARH